MLEFLRTLLMGLLLVGCSVVAYSYLRAQSPPLVTPAPTATPTPIALAPGSYSLSQGHYDLQFKPGATIIPDTPQTPNAYYVQ
jgi:hypothetical protein